jgi:transcriptional regulator with XRE-family HTH domain
MVGLNIGSRIRRLRMEQRRTQQEIADACGFTKSLLSKIESDKVMPPVATLVKIASSLGAKVSALIEADDSVGVVPATAKEVDDNIVKTERGYWIYPFATRYVGKRMQPFLFVARKGEVKEHHLAHEGEEFIYVLEGEMTVEVGPTAHRLKAGSSVYFDSMRGHQVIPISDTVKYLNIFV